MTRSAGTGFQVMVKPVGATCDLACSYCYYLGTAALLGRPRPPAMSRELLEAFTAQYLKAAGEHAVFAWHGGEPTLAGLDFFRAAVALQKEHRRPGQDVVNNLQTNGLGLDDAWGDFLARERFSVGLSLDGPKELHDVYRRSRAGAPTQARVVDALGLLSRHRVHCDVLCVVHDRNVDEPRTLYRYFKSLGVRFLQFLPLVERDPDLPTRVTSRSLSAQTWGDFLCKVFDEWIRQDVGRVVVQIFDEAFRSQVGVEHALCVHREHCGDVLALEANGEVFSCDHFVDMGHKLGTISDTPLSALAASEAQRRFGEEKETGLTDECRACPALAFCHGGCPKDRLAVCEVGGPRRPYLCLGTKRFHAHSRPFLAELARLWLAHEPMEKVMTWARATDEKRAQVGRNDPCPCGSGRKYKRCCLKL